MKKETNVFSNIESFKKKFSKIPKGERLEALKVYFNSNGVIRAYTSEKDWPKLTYPNYFVLEKKLNELKSKRNLFEKNLASWEKKYSQAENYHRNNQIKKLKEPLYWKHKAKMIVDPDYRKDSEQVKLPVHLVSDDKWKPMVKMFVNDLDYRKQLAETVRESIVYKKDKKVAKYADELKDFRMKTSNKQVEELEKKIKKIEELEKSLKEIQKWAKE
ncbi:MAG: hypothetical protein PHP82_01720 [Candidatus ainarchaeum sp.]|nr:hypothetical protein [Candidatus ainarchaeum sp.]